MTNEQVKNGFNEVYNGFWTQYRDKLPDRDSEEWERMWDYVKELQGKYPFMADALRKMMIEFDERLRG